MCATLLKDISEAAKEIGKEGAQAKAIASSFEFSKVQAEIAAQRDPAGRLPLHPKMVELKNLIIQHFGQLMADPSADAEAAVKGSRVMVFAAFREVVDEIVDVLNEERPLIRAMRLIGQGADKQGNLGLNQRAQQEVRLVASSLY
jgi:ATP-dependent DNA helicase MPH1